MTKIDLFSGFLGAGKTTLIKKLIREGYQNESLVLIENEFGEIGIDGGFMQDAGITVNEMNSGCICCSLVGDFSEALKKVLDEYHPDRILIEPSGVGKLSDVIRAVRELDDPRAELNCCCTVVDAKKCKMYMKNFGEFFNDQIQSAGVIAVSHTGGLPQDKLDTCVALLKEQNDHASVLTTPWEEITGAQLLHAMEHTFAEELRELEEEHHHDHDEHCHEHHHDHDEHCHEHHHDHDEHCHEHHHDHDEHCHEHHHDHDEHCHEHHHEHDENCTCGCHDHDHHHHHHADEVFTSWGRETVRRFGEEELRGILTALESGTYGTVLRAKGIVAGDEGWIHFDYVPGEPDIRGGAADVTGRLCVIGAELKEDALAELFGI